ncbi:MAG: hypothetical protein U5R30_21975 [Deltaproteobacteria bacterium]|nr:hypothetical protein [Deltaproteobacteria bacterium]
MDIFLGQAQQKVFHIDRQLYPKCNDLECVVEPSAGMSLIELHDPRPISYYLQDALHFFYRAIPLLSNTSRLKGLSIAIVKHPEAIAWSKAGFVPPTNCHVVSVHSCTIAPSIFPGNKSKPGSMTLSFIFSPFHAYSLGIRVTSYYNQLLSGVELFIGLYSK